MHTIVLGTVSTRAESHSIRQGVSLSVSLCNLHGT